MNREQPAKQTDFQSVVTGSTPVRFTILWPCGGTADTVSLDLTATACGCNSCQGYHFSWTKAK
jgi:hypothetical protein